MRFYQNCSADGLADALQAAEAGRAVFPLHYKEPTTGATPNGHKDASRDRARIHALFNRAGRRATGYGIRTGSASGLVVVDVDSAEGVAEVKRLGLTTDYIVRSGRPEGNGWHLYFSLPAGVELAGGDLGEYLRLQGDGQFVVGPGSVHPSGRVYELVRDGEMAPAPAQLLARAQKRGRKPRPAKLDGSVGPISVDVAGPPIVEGQPGRNLELARIAGRLHDGTRSLDELARDLDGINQARCQPPVPFAEVAKIARSIHKREPCKPPVSDRVRGAVAYLREAAEERPVKGKGGASGWSIYNAGLEALERFGKEHAEGVTLRLDVRTWAQMAGKSAATVSRWIKRSPMVRLISRGSGRRAMTVLFYVPKRILKTGYSLQHSSTRGVSQNKPTSGSVALRPLFRTLYRSRWSKRARRPRRGLAGDTRRVRQYKDPPSEGIRRMGPSQAALLWKIRTHPDAKRSELASMLGRKPDSLKKPLQTLHSQGMIVRTGYGRYRAAEDLERRLEDARELGEEPLEDRLQIQRHARERTAYRNRGKASEAEKSEGTAAGRKNVEHSRRERARGMREQAERERERAERERQTPEEEHKRQKRIARLIREGMSRRLAEAEVDGLDPFGAKLAI